MNRPLHLLIVDDDADDVDFLSAAFRLHDPEILVTHCKDGTEAISFLASVVHTPDCPDMTFLDLHMPGRSGYDTLLLLRQNETCDAMPIMILSTSLQQQEARKCREAGCTDFFSKPMTLAGYDEIVSKSMAYLQQSEDNVAATEI